MFPALAGACGRGVSDVPCHLAPRGLVPWAFLLPARLGLYRSAALAERRVFLEEVTSNANLLHYTKSGGSSSKACVQPAAEDDGMHSPAVVSACAVSALAGGVIVRGWLGLHAWLWPADCPVAPNCRLAERALERLDVALDRTGSSYSSLVGFVLALLLVGVTAKIACEKGVAVTVGKQLGGSSTVDDGAEAVDAAAANHRRRGGGRIEAPRAGLPGSSLVR